MVGSDRQRSAIEWWIVPSDAADGTVEDGWKEKQICTATSEQVSIVVLPNIKMKQRLRALDFDRRRDLIMGLVSARTPHCIDSYLPHDHHGFNLGQRSRSHHAKSAPGHGVLRLRFRIIRRVLWCTDTVSNKIGGTTTCLVPRFVPPTPRWSAT